MTDALLIFIKNPELGKAKTRLAATLGKEKALEIYLHLLGHTRAVATAVNVERHLFYSQFVDTKDEWPNTDFQKGLQDPNPDLGQKMFKAFSQLLAAGKNKVLIIGSDCLDLSSEIIKMGFEILSENDALIGPAKDGGYYSIGFNFERLGSKSNPLLESTFLNKDWSHENVCLEAINVFVNHSVNFAKLPVLSDIDVEEDIQGRGLL